MSKMEYEKFTTLSEEYTEGHDVADIVAEVREKFGDEIVVVTPYIVDEAIANIVRKRRRRRAKLVIEGHGDLFAGFSVPSMDLLRQWSMRQVERSRRIFRSRILPSAI
jgi:hypothetical protein